eukprot:s2035_g14.t2
MADELLEVSGRALARESEIHQSTPIGFLIGEKLGQLREDLMHPLQPQQHSRQVVSRLLAFSRKAFEHVNWIVWRDTHFVWLKDSLSEGRVVHSAWGPADRWSELGAHDAFASHDLLGGSARAPVYAFANEGSQRQERSVPLSRDDAGNDHGIGGWKKAHELEGRTLVVVEIGVFKGSLSKHVLEKLPFVKLLGVDPYIGKDGTFPGDFSETLDPDMALAQAQKLYEGFADRAQLLPTTSEEAARTMPLWFLAAALRACHLRGRLPPLRVAYRIPGAPNAEWVDIYNRLYRERIIFIGKEIDDKLANEVIGVLLYLDSEDSNKPIYLYINSAGGSVISGLSIYDTMQHIKSPVITINVGLAASMASFLLAAGEKGKRIALPHSRTMIHQAMGGAQGQAEDIKVEAQQILQIHENIVRMYSRVTGQNEDTIRKDLMRDNFMSAEEAKEYGLIDQVIQLADASDLKAVADKVTSEAPKESAAPPSPPPEVPDKTPDSDEDEVKPVM